MEQPVMEETLLKLLKKFLLVAIGSGILGNALYIHGLAYYEGYIGGLGFEYDFFPLDDSNVLFWTYMASRELGASSILALADFQVPIVFLSIGIVYLISRLWMEISNPSIKKNKKNYPKYDFQLAKKINSIKRKYGLRFMVFYVPLRWLILKEQSFIAFAASYFFLIFMAFLPIFIVIWIYFPFMGIAHGESVAKDAREYYQENLCGGDEDYWSRCITIRKEYLEDYKELSFVKGRVILNDSGLLGIYTKDGPVVIAMPKKLYLKSEKNKCYGGCDNSKATVTTESK